MSRLVKKKGVLGIKIRNQSSDLKEEEKKRKQFECLLQKINSNDNNIKELLLPTIPLSNYYNSLLIALNGNRNITSINTSHCKELTSKHITEILSILDKSNNYSLQRIDFRNTKQDSESIKSILNYISQHLHIVDLRFSDPFNDPQQIISDKDKKRSQKIYYYLASNKRMHAFLKGETNKFECQARGIVVTQGFIKPDWGKRMTSLDLSGNRLFHLPNFFIDFTLLSELLLPNNDLCKLPRWIGKLINLRILDATNNSIRAIPDGIYSLSQLQTLNLSSNNISRVPLFLGNMPFLTVLSLNANPIMNMPRDIIKSADYGDSNILLYLKHNLDRIVRYQLLQENIELPSSYSIPNSSDIMEYEEIPIEDIISILCPQDISALHSRKQAILDGKHEIIPLSKQKQQIQTILLDPKDLCSLLEPQCRSNCLSIAKISDSIWCGTNSGSVYIWDARTCRFKETLELHDHSVVSLLEVPFPHLESWSADNLGMINIYELKNKKSMQIEVFELAIGSMLYVKDTEEVWVSSGTSICRISVRTRGILTRNILVDSPIRGFVYTHQQIWVACQTGVITIFRKDGSMLRSFPGHIHPILSIVSIGDFVWTCCKSQIKIWKLQEIKFGVNLIACHCILYPEDITPPLIASKDEQFIYSVGGSNNPQLILQWTSSGELVNSFSFLHESDTVIDFTFSVSPDRLWSASSNGTVCWYELKRGKKTIERLQGLQIQDEVAELGIIDKIVDLESLRMELSDDDIPDDVFSNSDLELSVESNDDIPPPPIEVHPCERKLEQPEDDNTILIRPNSPPPIEPHPFEQQISNIKPPPLETHPLELYDNQTLETAKDTLDILASNSNSNNNNINLYNDLDNDPILSINPTVSSVKKEETKRRMSFTVLPDPQ